MAEIEYNRIIYPERAEYLSDSKFESYKVFLQHWDGISSRLKNNFEEALLRGVSKTLLVYGAQSTGKTLLGNKLSQDHILTHESIKIGKSIAYDENNIWHRIVSGFGKNVELIQKNTQNSSLLHIEDQKGWVEEVERFCKANNGRTSLVIADNCERDYFAQSLVGLSAEQFLAVGRTDALIANAAQKYVALCRTEFKGALVVMFTNDELFALKFEEAVNSQHKGLVETIDMPIPGPRDKETVVRVNTNRLNPFSYWYCLDRAGIEEKKNVFNVLQSQTGFKESFEAVDNAIQKASPSRIGRPPKKCLLSLFCLTDTNDVTGVLDNIGLGELERNVDVNSVVDVVTVKDSWSGLFDVGGHRQQRLLQSEWTFRLILAGNHFASELLHGNGDLIKALIEKSLRYHGPGTRVQTILDYKAEFARAVDKVSLIPVAELSGFWSAGQVRSGEYESALRKLFPNYNVGSTGFLQYRPDLILEPYKVCELSISPSVEDADINETIRRNASVCEFTAFKQLTMSGVQSYLNHKLKNYVEILQEQ